MDLRGIPGPRVKRLRYVTPEQWFPEQRDVGVDRRFHTLLQESFYHAYCELDIKISEHKDAPLGAYACGSRRDSSASSLREI